MVVEFAAVDANGALPRSKSAKVGVESGAVDDVELGPRDGVGPRSGRHDRNNRV